jgi:hypothetical protein
MTMIIGAFILNFKYLIRIILGKNGLCVRNSITIWKICCSKPYEAIKFLAIEAK